MKNGNITLSKFLNLKLLEDGASHLKTGGFLFMSDDCRRCQLKIARALSILFCWNESFDSSFEHFLAKLLVNCARNILCHPL